jgi:hypothetical protein
MHMAKKDSTAAPTNPLIDEIDPLQTLENVEGVIWFVTLTATDLADNGTNEQATHGFAMIMECAACALSNATQALQPKGVKHG